MSSSKRLGILFAVMLVGALLPTYLYTQRPETVVRSALKKLDGDISFMAAVTIGTFAPDSVVRAAGGDPATMLLPLVFVGEGGVNIPKEKPPSCTATFQMVGSAPEGKELTLDASFGQDGKAYARLVNLPSNPASAALVAQLDGKWFSMENRTLVSLLAREDKSVPKEENPTGSRPAATWQTLRKELSSDGFFGTPVPLGLKTFTSAPVRHFALPVVRERSVTFAQDLKSLVLGRSLSAEELAQVAKEMENRKIELEIWINTREKELAQLQLTISTLDGAKEESKDANHVSLLIKFTSWGTPVEVKVPEESRPYSEIIAPIKQP